MDLYISIHTAWMTIYPHRLAEKKPFLATWQVAVVLILFLLLHIISTRRAGLLCDSVQEAAAAPIEVACSDGRQSDIVLALSGSLLQFRFSTWFVLLDWPMWLCPVKVL